MIENIHLWNPDRGTYFDRNVNIISWSDEYNIHVGKYCSIGRDCNFFLHANHRPDWITTSSQLWGPVTHEIAQTHMEMGHPSCKGDIIVENDVWIGAESMIMPGIQIADGAVIGARSLVTKNVGAYEIWGGNPARLIKKRFTDSDIQKLLKIKWWDWNLDKLKKNLAFIRSSDIDLLWSKYQEGKL